MTFLEVTQTLKGITGTLERFSDSLRIGILKRNRYPQREVVSTGKEMSTRGKGENILGREMEAWEEEGRVGGGLWRRHKKASVMVRTASHHTRDNIASASLSLSLWRLYSLSPPIDQIKISIQKIF